MMGQDTYIQATLNGSRFLRSGSLLFHTWKYCKFTVDSPTRKLRTWRRRGLIHGRFSVCFCFNDPEAKKQTAWKFYRARKDCDTLWLFRLQIIRLWLQACVFRRLLWSSQEAKGTGGKTSGGRKESR